MKSSGNAGDGTVFEADQENHIIAERTIGNTQFIKREPIYRERTNWCCENLVGENVCEGRAEIKHNNTGHANNHGSRSPKNDERNTRQPTNHVPRNPKRTKTTPTTPLNGIRFAAFIARPRLAQAQTQLPAGELDVCLRSLISPWQPTPVTRPEYATFPSRRRC